MRKVEGHAELAELIRQGHGFIFNNRIDRRMLHQVNCESLEVMSTRAYEKLFFEDQPPEMGSVVAVSQVGGLHHRYERRVA